VPGDSTNRRLGLRFQSNLHFDFVQAKFFARGRASACVTGAIVDLRHVALSPTQTGRPRLRERVPFLAALPIRSTGVPTSNSKGQRSGFTQSTSVVPTERARAEAIGSHRSRHAVSGHRDPLPLGGSHRRSAEPARVRLVHSDHYAKWSDSRTCERSLPIERYSAIAESIGSTHDGAASKKDKLGATGRGSDGRPGKLSKAR